MKITKELSINQKNITENNDIKRNINYNVIEKKHILIFLLLILVFGFLISNLIYFAQQYININMVNKKNNLVINYMTLIPYVIGMFLSIKGIINIKEYNDTHGQIPLSKGIISLTVASFLLILPNLLNDNNNVNIKNKEEISSSFIK